MVAGKAAVQGRETFSEFYTWGMPERMIRTNEWKYIHTDGQVCQLYDVNGDRLERTNLAVDPAYADLCKRLSDRVHQGWEKPDPDVIAPRPKPF